MVYCMQMSMLVKAGLSRKKMNHSKAVIRGVTGADLGNKGTIIASVTCNNITADAKFYVTKLECPFILGLGFCEHFKLVKLAPACIKQSMIINHREVEAVHITDESEVNYTRLRNKWEKHLPLRRKTGDPLEDLKDIFPETFDGQVGLFEGEVSLKLAPDAKPVQLPATT